MIITNPSEWELQWCATTFKLRIKAKIKGSTRGLEWISKSMFTRALDLLNVIRLTKLSWKIHLLSNQVRRCQKREGNGEMKEVYKSRTMFVAMPTCDHDNGCLLLLSPGPLV